MARYFLVEAGHIAAFARAVGDPAPAYTDPDHPGGVIAPPTFARAYTLHDLEAQARWFSSATPRRTGSLHAEQSFEYHRPMRPGDLLTVEVVPGRVWQREGRTGLLEFTETVTRFRDRTGAPVVTTRSVSARPGAAPDPAAGPAPAPQPAPEPVGEAHTTTVCESLTRLQIARYAGASGDFNPLHTDEPYAVAAGHPSVMAHGMLTMGLTARPVTAHLGAVLTHYRARFAAPVWPGDTLTVTVTPTASGLTFVTRNQHGTPVLQGSATAAA